MNYSKCGNEFSTSPCVSRGIDQLCYAKLKMDEKRENPSPGEIALTTDMGGEIAELIKETASKSFKCLGLPKGHLEIVETWLGYPHDGGFSDKDGKKWWPYQKCSQSNYEMAYWKVKNRIVEIKEVTA